MLVAQTINGMSVSLMHHDWSFRKLDAWRRRTRFICPACQGTVILRLGDKKRWHFAHKNNASCSAQAEHETSNHILGKRVLHRWLKAQLYHPQLEHYLPQIKQRPDCYTEKTEPPLAIEFQCSTIPARDVMQRTQGYRSIKVLPLWILARERLKRVMTNIYQITGTDIATLQLSTQSSLVYFDPHERQFLLLHDIIPLTATRFYAQALTWPIQATPLSRLYEVPERHEKALTTAVLQQKKRLRTNQIPPQTPDERYVQQMLALRGYSLYSFPDFAGLPSARFLPIQTPAYLWQIWLIVQFLLHKRGDTFHKNNILQRFHRLIQKGVFRLRETTYPMNGVNKAISHYLFLLTERGLLSQSQDQYQVISDIKWRNMTLDEALECDISCLKRLVMIL
ncbi:competence protein CoiA [Tuberibacillus sp. Marseille-P3662]|uniref:competence protein CoiA n=1 Tax=Tuberibacillus sp. Marseille-P3662 TaxID=1965358 RepID=UPI000A1CC90C|nr:competence protein CoiA family protein [Tuberibacillus sp. Marseille-P3662]